MMAAELGPEVNSLNEVFSILRSRGNPKAAQVVLTSEAGPVLDFDALMKHVQKSVSQEWHIKAAPNGYAAFKKTYDNDGEPDPESADFTGSKLHSSIGATSPSFGDAMGKSNIVYHEERGRSPLVTFLGNTVRQGVNTATIETAPLKASVRTMRDAAYRL